MPLSLRSRLPAGEIVGQLPLMEKAYGRRVTNIVMMGMGEPFLNRNNLFKVLGLLTDPDGMAVSHRKLTVSTVGWLPGIIAMTKAGMRVKLAISLNGTTEEQRQEWLPMAARYSITDVLATGKAYVKQAGNRLGVSYLMLSGVNDSDQDARRLGKLLHGIPCKVNLMEYNETSNLHLQAAEDRVDSFVSILRKPGITVTVRSSRGGDIEWINLSHDAE